MHVLETLVAPCGLHCGVCPLYKASSNPQLAQMLAEKYNTKPEYMTCTGCRPAKGSPTPLRGTVCKTYACAEEKGFHLCNECNDFPCNRLAPLADRAALVPHNTKIFNLLRIRRDGLEAWSNEAERLNQQYFGAKIRFGDEPQKS